MDKLRLYSPHITAIPVHIRKTLFECTGTKNLPKGLKIYYWLHRETGVHLTHSPNGLTIETNPTRWMNGNNLHMIDRVGLMNFMEHMKEMYETDFGCWKVSMFDYNSDIEVNDKPARYFALLGGFKTWDIKEYNKTGVNYATPSNTKAVTCYDLHKRCIKERTTPPISNKIIRIEASFNKMLTSVKELKNMQTLNDYTQPENYKKLPELWLTSYETIDKNEPVEHVDGLTNKEQMLLAMIEKYTLRGYRDKLKVDYPKNYGYYYNQLDALLEKVRQYRQKRDILNQLDELNLKVRTRAKELILAA